MIPSGSRTASAAASTGSSYAAVDGQVSNMLFEGDEAILFGDFLKIGLARSERCYEPLPSMPKLAQLMERYLEEFNASRGKAGSVAMAEAAAAAGTRKGAGAAAAAAGGGGGGGGRMDLVFFRDAVMHVVRLARVLRQPRWVGGSQDWINGKAVAACHVTYKGCCDAPLPGSCLNVLRQEARMCQLIRALLLL
jgi:hypothetical protein